MEDNVNVNTQMPPDLAAKLDELRGDRSRSQFIRLLINQEWERSVALPARLLAEDEQRRKNAEAQP